jgi:hypothetical protein
MKFQNKTAPELRTSFYRFIQQEGYGTNVVPVLSYAYENPTWPLDEDYSKSTLMLYNKNIMKLEDVKGDYPTYSSALHKLITDDDNDLPPGVIKSIQRSVIYALKADTSNKNRNVAPILNNGQREQRLHARDIGDGNGDLYGLTQDEDNQEDNDIINVYGRNVDNNDNVDNDIGLLETDIHEAESDYFDNTIYREHRPSFDDLFIWIDKTVDEFNISNETNKTFSLPQFIDRRENSTSFGQLYIMIHQWL